MAALSGRRAPWLERVLRKVEAVNSRYRLYGPDDPVLVGISGGKDSLALLALLVLQGRGRRSLYACLVDNERMRMPPEALISIAEMCASLEVPFSVRTVNIGAEQGCFLCARARRKALAEEAAARGVRRIALGHSMTDAAQTVLLNLAQKGRLEGLDPIRWYFNNAFAIVRPLLFCDETDTRRVAARFGLPVYPSPCLLAGTTARAKAAIALEHLRRVDRNTTAHIAGTPIQEPPCASR